MGTKRSIRYVTNNTEENLSVPPGFVSLTSFTLKRRVTDPMAVAGESGPGLISAPLSNVDIEKLKTSFVQRPWNCHDQLDHVPEKYDCEETEVEMKDPVSACLPKGVIHGCAKCNDCVKVTARWHPEEACLPAIDDAPVCRPTEEVLCGTNLGCQTLGSGFPIKGGPAGNMAEYSGYVESGWNLNNTPKLSGSLLPFGCYNTSAILVPQLYIGMCFASQCWRNEDHHLYSLSYMHLGDPKVWYGVPGRYRFKFVEVVKKLLPQLSKHPKLLHDLVAQLSPSMLMSEGIPVYRCVQNHSEFVLIFPGAYHSEFSCGFNCSEAVCFAPFDWLPHGQDIVELYAAYCLKTSISHDRLLLGAAMEAVSTQWESFAMKNSSFNNQLSKSVYGKDGILTKLLKSRVRNEGLRRKHLCNPWQSRELDEFDVATKRECCICLYDLYLSAVGCLCSPNRYSCLRHAKELCSCAWDTKYFYFRYEIAELNLLVEALEGNLKALHSWAKRKGQPDASLQLNPGNNVREQEKSNVISPRMSADSPYESNGIASNKKLIPPSNWANEENIKSTVGSGSAYGRNVIASNKSVMPASERRGAKDEHRSTTCMFPSPGTSPLNNAYHSASSLSTQKNVAQNVVILLSDNED
ncbi:putative lysine-specific demethylase [Sesamum alatum]|uniref:Lysine-specific demethylase n=1 Tax=Sesamum alatum TaxID=300844 RepID=A0AAE1XUS4_9LAMI|nr:putative lysine-specific demethylase [Sesamum alatum]